MSCFRLQKEFYYLSFPRRRESSFVMLDWIPAFAGMTMFILFFLSFPSFAEYTKHDIQADLKTIQQQSIKQAKAIRKKQGKIQNIENELEQLNFQAKQKEKQLKTITKQLNQATNAMIDIVSVPQGIALLNPDKDNIITIEILSSITEQYTEITEEFKKEVADINDIKSIILTRQETLKSELKNLQKKQANLKTGLTKRQTLYKQINTGYKKVEKQAENIKKQSKDTTELTTKLASITPVAKPSIRHKPLKNEKFKKGNLLMPIRGKISDKFNSNNQGIKIKSAKSSSVIAPFGGKILFASTFRDYGNTVIIKYNNTYHSVIAGLSDIAVITGQHVLKGEPIGNIGKNQLYFELRKNSEPINPTKWFSK